MSMNELENLKDYNERGFACLSDNISDEEFRAVNQYLEGREKGNHPGNIYDSAGRLRAVHGYDSGFSPSLIERLSKFARTLIGCEQVYVYQFRANIKHPVTEDSGGWQPHRDFDYWQQNDGMSAPHAAIFHILVTDHTRQNGPLILCDGSHKLANVQIRTTKEDTWQANFGENLKFTIPQNDIESWRDKTTLMGTAGAVYAMHPLTWHYSEPNRSENVRTLLSIVFNDLDNQPVLPEGAPKRPEFIVEQPR